MTHTAGIRLSEIPAPVSRGIGRTAFELFARVKADPRHAEVYEDYLRREMECRGRQKTGSDT